MEEQRRKYQAGDRIYHYGVDENWILACDENKNEIVCCGWPETYSNISVIKLLEPSSLRERVKMLFNVSKSNPESYRRSLAQRQLEELKQIMSEDKEFQEILEYVKNEYQKMNIRINDSECL